MCAGPSASASAIAERRRGAGLSKLLMGDRSGETDDAGQDLSFRE